MKKISLLLITLVFVSFACNRPVDATDTFQLVDQGLPKATIIIGTTPSPAAKLAAVELQYHIKLVTGVELPIVQDGQPVEGNKIHVGDTRLTKELGLRSTDFEPQEYMIQFNGENLILYGRDWYPTATALQETGRSIVQVPLTATRVTIDYNKATYQVSEKERRITLPGIYDDQSSLYAAYDFMERALGIRWYGPADFNVVYTPRKNIAIERFSLRRSPKMKYRDGTGLDGPMLSVQYGTPPQEAEELFHRRLRKGGEKWGANHSFSSFQDRFLIKNSTADSVFEENREEYFAKGRSGGPHQRQLCYTNQALINQVTQDARDYFDGKGVVGRQIAMGDYFAVLPLDNASWCLGAKCQAALAKEKEQYSQRHFSSGIASDYLFGFINQIAKGVAETHPNKKIATLAYHVYSYYPDSVQLESNVSVSPCLHNRHYMSPEMKKHEFAWYKKWVANSKAPLYLWNYSTFPTERGVYGFGGLNGTSPWNVFPGFSAHAQAELINMYHNDNVRGVFLCGVGEQLDYYLAMKHYDNPDLDIDKEIDDFFNLYFGNASDPMRQFYTTVEHQYNNFDLYPDRVKGEKHFQQDEEIAWKYLGTDKVMKELEGYVKQAKQADISPVERKRVESWREAIWEYMKKGKKQYLEKAAKNTNR